MDPRYSEHPLNRLSQGTSTLSLRSLAISISSSDSESTGCSTPTSPSTYGYKFGTVPCCNNHDTIPRHRKHRHSTHGLIIRDEYYSNPALGVLRKKKSKRQSLLFALLSSDNDNVGIATPSACKKKVKSSGKPGFKVTVDTRSCEVRRRHPRVAETLEESARALEQAILSTTTLLERTCKEISPSNKSSNGSRRVASPFEIQPSPPTTPPNEEEKMDETLESFTIPSMSDDFAACGVKERSPLGSWHSSNDVDDVRPLADANLQLMKGLQRKFDTLRQLQEKMHEDNSRLEELLAEAEANKNQAEASRTLQIQSSPHEKRNPSPQPPPKEVNKYKLAKEPGMWEGNATESRHKRRSTASSLPFFKPSSVSDDLKPKRRFSASAMIGRTKTSSIPVEPVDDLEKATMHLPKLERYPCIHKDF